MGRLFFVASLLALSSCLANRGLGTATAAELNIDRMQQVCLGMSEEEVYKIMRFPAIDEQIITEDGCYDVWFYVTRAMALDQSEFRPHNLTPLIFKDGILIGRGYDYYNHLRAKQPVSMSSKPSQPPKKEEKPSKPNKADDDVDPEKPYRWDDDDDRMIEQGSEQNFDYW